MTGVMYFPSANTLLMLEKLYTHTADRSDVALKKKYKLCHRTLNYRILSKVFQKTQTYARLWCEDCVEQAVLPALLGVTPVISVLNNVRQLRLKHWTVHSGLQERCPFSMQDLLASKIPL